MVVVGVALAGLLVVVAVLAAGLVAVVDAHRQAQAAADLAALAGAGAAQDGRPACAEAASVARRNGAAEVDCTTDGSAVTVVVGHALRLGGLHATLRARARAGPVEAGPGGD